MYQSSAGWHKVKTIKAALCHETLSLAVAKIPTTVVIFVPSSYSMSQMGVNKNILSRYFAIAHCQRRFDLGSYDPSGNFSEGPPRRGSVLLLFDLLALVRFSSKALDCGRSLWVVLAIFNFLGALDVRKSR